MFGGGIAMLPILERELSEKRNWVAQDELVDYFAIGQSTPGIIAVNVATFCGYKIANTFGGIVATIAIVTPAVIIITVLSYAIDCVNNILWVKKALMGINAAVAANLTYATINLFKKSIKNIFGIILFIISFGCVYFLKIPAVLIILSSIILGIILFFIGKNKKCNQH